MINEFEIDWRQRVRENSINAIQNLEIVRDLVQEISDDDESNDEFEQESMGFTEIIRILDKLKRCLCLTMIAKTCCPQSRKRLRPFN